jgi:hypothetical protein
MLRMCVYMHSRFIENHPIRILEDGSLISEVVLSQHASHPPLPLTSPVPRRRQPPMPTAVRPAVAVARPCATHTWTPLSRPPHNTAIAKTPCSLSLSLSAQAKTEPPAPSLHFLLSVQADGTRSKPSPPLPPLLPSHPPPPSKHRSSPGIWPHRWHRPLS